MNESEPIPRSPELMSRTDSGLLVVDVQEKLVPLIQGHERLLWNLQRLIDGAEVLGVALGATEQYPQGLGKTVPRLPSSAGEVPDKVTFSCRACTAVFDRFHSSRIGKIVVCGIETHVCIQQTVHDLLAEGFRIYLPVDAVGTRHLIDHETALRRMDSAGATLTTVESVLFEWCESAGTAEFKQISALVRQSGP